jgi:hypothetical protein
VSPLTPIVLIIVFGVASAININMAPDGAINSLSRIPKSKRRN